VIAVQFHEVDEFLDELDRSAEDPDVAIERSIIRVTTLLRTPPLGGRTVWVAAAFVSSKPPWEQELVHVQTYAGALTGFEENDDRTTDRRDALLQAIRDAAARHGLEIRPGILHEAARA
jgi:hypothetical protein